MLCDTMKHMRTKHFSVAHCTRLVLALGWSDFVLKYRGSVLGYVWSLLVPLSRFIVIFLVLEPFVADGQSSYPLSLLLGLLLWDFFASATNACVHSLRDKSDLIERVAFPRIVIELSAVWTQLIVVVCNLVLFLIVTWALGTWPTVGILLLVPTLLGGISLALGIGAVLASFSLKYRDIPHLWQSVLQILFWLTPVAYPAESLVRSLALHDKFPEFLRTAFSLLISVQPLSVFIESARSAIIGTPPPSVTAYISFLLISMGVGMTGTMIFIKRSRKFLEEL